MKFRVRLHISYDGTDYQGWQIQTPEKPTIQAEIQRALQDIFGNDVRLVGSGRTDSGVHAWGQVAHFDTNTDPSRYQLIRILREHLPKNIHVREAWTVPNKFHSQQSAIRKTYRYRVLNGSGPNPFQTRYMWWYRLPLELEKLNNISKLVNGTMDYAAFQTRGVEVEDTVRTIFHSEWTKKGDVLSFTVTGSGFLTHMVRNIVGTTIFLHRKGMGPSEMQAIIDSRDRRKAHAAAPPHGLMLLKVNYPPHLDIKYRKL